MKLVSFDPGGTTGYAVAVENEIIEVGEFLLWRGAELLIRDADTVLYENIRPRSASFDTVGIQVIGVIRYLCEEYGKEPIPREPSMLSGPRLWRPELPSIVGYHAADAIWHLLAYCRDPGMKVTDVS